GDDARDQKEGLYQRRLTGAIFERIYADTRRAGIPMMIQSIPHHGEDPESLIEAFPLEEFNLNQEGLYFVPGKDFLAPVLGKAKLYWEHSDGHWTPLSHHRSAQAMADVILREGLLR